MGGRNPSRMPSTVAARPAAPHAPWGWPIMDLIEEPGSLAAAGPNAIFTARVSTRSFSAVEVPWYAT